MTSERLGDLRRAQAAYGTAVNRLRTAYADFREVCTHELVAEACVGWEPLRICEDCGIEEHHGSTGFHVLVTDRLRRVTFKQFLQLRPRGSGDSLVRWCYGNRFFAAHMVLHDLTHGRMNGDPRGAPTRCCAEHDLEYAGKVISAMPPEARDRIRKMTRNELNHWLAHYRQLHP